MRTQRCNRTIRREGQQYVKSGHKKLQSGGLLSEEFKKYGSKISTSGEDIARSFPNNFATFSLPKTITMNFFQQPRRTFLQKGIAGFCTALFAGLPNINFARSGPGTNKGIVVRENEGTRILTRRKVPITIKISKAKQGIEGISFCVEEQTPGRKMRIHKHLNNDELIFIHKGKGTLTLGEESIEVGSGDVVFVPRGLWHGLDNTGDENLFMVFQYSPAGFEEYFIENGTPDGIPAKERSEAEYTITEKRYGMVYKDPR